MAHLLPFKSLQCHALILFVVMANIAVISGCAATKFGYIPEDVTPSDKNARPKCSDVKEWAYAVADGYDTRATMNKYAIYGGALIGAAAASAIAGLAAFDSGSSALVGIPIGATFLASVAVVYSNEEKARIYRLRSQYIKDFITLSDKRFYQCTSGGTASTISQDAKKAVEDANKRLEDAIRHEELLTQRAKDAHAGVDKLGPGASKDLEAAIAKDVDNRKAEATRAVAKAKADARSAAKDARDAEQCPKKKEDEQLQEKEALCLRVDVNGVMRAVEDRKADLEPDDIVKRLKDVGAPATSSEAGNTSSSGSASNDGTTGTVSAVPGYFIITDLNPPVKSSCGQF
jgi:hypothetical protein